MWFPLISNRGSPAINSTRLLFAVAVFAVFWAHSWPTAWSTDLCVVDDLPRKVCLSSSVHRVISLAPRPHGNRLFSGGRFTPRGAFRPVRLSPEARKLVPVGAYMKPDLERIVSLKPDLILTTKTGARKELVYRLDSLGIPVFVSNSENVGDIFKLVLRLGKLLGKQQTAESLVRDARADLTNLKRSIAHADRPTVLFAVGVRPLFVAGGDSFIGSLIREAGGSNIAEKANVPYLRYSTEEVLARDPDFIFTLNKDCAGQRECLKHGRDSPF